MAQRGDLMSDLTTADVFDEYSRRTKRDRPLGLPAELATMIHNAQRGEGQYAPEIQGAGSVSNFLSIPGNVISALAEMTGIPSIVRGVANIRRGYDEGSPLRMAGGAGQAALGAVPGVSALRPGMSMMRAMADPVRGAALGGAVTLPQALLDVSDANAQTAQGGIIAKLQAMSPDEIKAYQALIGAQPDGRLGPDTLRRAAAYEAAQAERQRAAEAEAKASRAVDMARVQGDSEAKKAAAVAEAEIRARAEAEAKARAQTRDDQAKLPMRQLYPNASAFVPVLSAMIAGATGGKILGSYASRYNKKLDDLVPRWKAATDAKDPALAQAFAGQISSLRRAGPGGLLPAVAAGGAEGGFIGLLPEEIDVGRGIPGAVEKFISLDTLKRGALTVAMGAAAGGTAALGVGAKYRKAEPVGDYTAETNVLNGVNQKSISTADAYRSYQDALSRNAIASGDARTREAVSAARNDGLMATARADAEALPGLLAQQRQSALDAAKRAADAERLAAPVQPAAGASAAQSAAPPVPQATAPIQPRPQLQPAPVQSRTALSPPPNKQPRRWANVWSDPARASVLDWVKTNPGVPIEALSAPMLRGMIIARLPPGAAQPSAALVRDRLSKLKDEIGRGTATTSKDLLGLLTTDPRRSRFSIAGPAIGAGAMGYGLMSDQPGQ